MIKIHVRGTDDRQAFYEHFKKNIKQIGQVVRPESWRPEKNRTSLTQPIFRQMSSKNYEIFFLNTPRYTSLYVKTASL